MVSGFSAVNKRGSELLKKENSLSKNKVIIP